MKTIGLALGSGGTRGWAHVGVIQALLDLGVKNIDFISGTSAGAIIGALYALSEDFSLLEKYSSTFDKSSYKELFKNFSLKNGLIGSGFFKSFLDEFLHGISFQDLRIPLVVVATDILSGRALYLDEGNVLQSVIASSSIPFVFEPVRRGDYLLADGAIMEPVPTRAMKNLFNPDLIVAVNLTPMPKFDKNIYNTKGKYLQKANIIKEMLFYGLAKRDVELADLVIDINLSEQIKVALQWVEPETVIKVGYDEMMKHKDQLLALL